MSLAGELWCNTRDYARGFIASGVVSPWCGVEEGDCRGLRTKRDGSGEGEEEGEGEGERLRLQIPERVGQQGKWHGYGAQGRYDGTTVQHVGAWGDG